MSRLAEFSRYIGLVVLLSAVVLLVPRATVGAWTALTRALRSLLSWRPGTVVAEPRDLPVEVTVGDRATGLPDEVLEHHGLPRLVHAVQELWAMARETVEAGALALAVAGLVLRATSAVVATLPEPMVLASDLLLVLGAFLLMQRIIRDYPPAVLAPYLRAARVRVSAQPVARGRARPLLEMLLVAPGFVALLAWPVEIARFVADKQFSGPHETVLVVWACELPWFLALVWFLARPLLPRRPAARHAAPRRPLATVAPLRSHTLPEQGRRAA